MNQENNGTYCSIGLSVESKIKLETFVKERLQMCEFLDKSHYHVTLVYSKKYCNIKNIENLEDVILSKPKKLSVFECKTDEDTFYYALVLEIESEDISYIHSKLLSLGCTSDYDEYRPHITLAYLFEKPTINENHIPDFDIELQNIKVENLNDSGGMDFINKLKIIKNDNLSTTNK